MEHTGIYTQPLWYYLHEKEIPYYVVPGSAVTVGLKVRRRKPDRADAVMIARFAMRFCDDLKPHRLPAHILQLIRMLFSYRYRLVKAKVLL